jgi:protein TonB
VEPVYPEEARRAGIEGTVQLEIWLDERGRVRKIRVLRSPGHGLDRAAVKAAARAVFRPGEIDGKPVPVKITIPYRFVLDD